MAKCTAYPVPALEKGLAILETLATAEAPLSLADLAMQLKRSRSELFRMLACLEQRGYLARDEVSGKYSLTLKLFSLTHAHPPLEKLLRAARAPMQTLAERTGESCHLSVLERGRLLVIAQHVSAARVRLSIEVGGEFDPVTTASGRLLLALQEESVLRELLGTSGSRGRLPAKDLAALRRKLAGLRRELVSTAESETIEGVRDVAVPVGNAGEPVLAALAITRLRRRGAQGDEVALVAALRRAASEITAALGLSPT